MLRRAANICRARASLFDPDWMIWPPRELTSIDNRKKAAVAAGLLMSTEHWQMREISNAVSCLPLLPSSLMLLSTDLRTIAIMLAATVCCSMEVQRCRHQRIVYTWGISSCADSIWPSCHHSSMEGHRRSRKSRQRALWWNNWWACSHHVAQ